MDLCLSGLVRRPCATKAFRKVGKSYATKTVHKTFDRKKPCAGLGDVVDLLREVLCEPCAAFCGVAFFLSTIQYSYMLCLRYKKAPAGMLLLINAVFEVQKSLWECYCS